MTFPIGGPLGQSL